jgi:hypothetical protein
MQEDPGRVDHASETGLGEFSHALEERGLADAE